MKNNKRVDIQEGKRKPNLVDFRNTKSAAWNNRRRFGI